VYKKTAHGGLVRTKNYVGFHNVQQFRRGFFRKTVEVFDLSDGYYWWPCFPGCSPRGKAIGPFKTSEEAYNDAMEKCK
jgi:hypothetical protein